MLCDDLERKRCDTMTSSQLISSYHITSHRKKSSTDVKRSSKSDADTDRVRASHRESNSYVSHNNVVMKIPSHRQ